MDVSKRSSSGGSHPVVAPPPPLGKKKTAVTTGGGTAAGSSSGVSSNTGTDQASQAAASLQLLLREDRLLQLHGLTASAKNPDASAFPYAAALLLNGNQEDNDDINNYNDSSSSSSSAMAKRQTHQQRAGTALLDVERKLALVESLAVKLSRTSPEAVAGHMLRLHGYQLPKENSAGAAKSAARNDSGEDGSDPASATTTTAAATTTTTTTTTTLATVRDRADRLERQSVVLENVAKRVEGSLQRGLTKMETACTRLERVLTLSSTLKMILRLQFENSKLQNYDLEDSRDLVRAASSVAVLEELLAAPELSRHQVPPIVAVERLRPQVEYAAGAVRRSAAALLEEQYSPQQEPQQQRRRSSVTAVSLHQLGATLQVYYHLGELPAAVWKAVDQAHGKAESVSRKLWNAVNLQNMTEQAKKKKAISSASPSHESAERQQQKQLRAIRAEHAQEWAEGITDVAVQVRNLHRVLCRKTDPNSRQVFIDVVAAAPVPDAYQIPDAYQWSINNKNRKKKNSGIAVADNNSSFNLFSLFWNRTCRSVATITENLLDHEQGKLEGEVAALYPAVRAAALDFIGTSFQETMSTSALDDASATPVAGVLGGSTLLDDTFLDWKTGQGSDSNQSSAGGGDNPQAAASADSWTFVKQPETSSSSLTRASQRLSSRLSSVSLAGGATAASLTAVCQSLEWKALQGDDETHSGLYPLQQAFLESCSQRLHEPMHYMFPENPTMDDDGAALSSGGLRLLPSKYDIQRFDENIRQELSLADPREGGGDLTQVTMIADCVVSVICQFCQRAKNAVSGVGEDGYLTESWQMTESLNHDRKLTAMMYAMAKYLKNAPEKTFVTPYQPATSPQHEEAAAMCQRALAPAVQDVENMVKGTIIAPLCRAINRRISAVLARMHLGVYMESSHGGTEDDTPAFVQKHLVPVLETVGSKIISRFPPDYAAMLTSTVTSFCIYVFISNVSLVRPLGESARLRITQDLADLEHALEEFVVKSAKSLSLSQIDNGKPYAELRAVRQLLFWVGLEEKRHSAEVIARGLLREVWMKDDIRPSTVLHYLFSYAPTLLSSPHHAKRMKLEEYVSALVQLDGAVEDGEDAAWMTIMSCCDSYQQRASSAPAGVVSDGDPRIAQVVMVLGPELMRRRRH